MNDCIVAATVLLTATLVFTSYRVSAVMFLTTFSMSMIFMVMMFGQVLGGACMTIWVSIQEEAKLLFADDEEAGRRSAHMLTTNVAMSDKV